MTLYELLQVDRKASKEVIQMAYKALAKKYHPDTNTEENRIECEDQMKLLNHARDVLSEDASRETYDSYLEDVSGDQKTSKTEKTNRREENSNNSSSEDEVLESERSLRPRPWARYIARGIDLILFFIFIYIMWAYIDPKSFVAFNVDNDLKAKFIGYLILTASSLFIEALFISTLSTTPGKTIFNLNAVDMNGKKLSFGKALERSYLVYNTGESFGVPGVYHWSVWNNYKLLKKNNVTNYDKDLGTMVITAPKRNIKVSVLIFLISFLAVGIPYGALYSAAELDLKPNISQEILIEKTNLERETSELKDSQSKLITFGNELKTLKEELILFKQEHKQDEMGYEFLLVDYNKEENLYKAMVNSYESKVKEYNVSVETYNTKYGFKTPLSPQ